MSSDNRSSQVGKRVVKYCLEGLMVAFAAMVIPQKKALKPEDVLSLALVAAATFAVLDLLAPTNADGVEDRTVANAARFGAGAGIGANLVGFPGGL
jgi:hypothetical protein